ncbi:heterogeneous nuclear ribonucleoprotein A3-like [Benincasa hispida]|uniref:heterogeneous nuclear ribonucleoprotein A3-like n=1 Tax=Benincasa hispida TaxID=102211 RepID=UPI0018FF6F1D|nr:heterogeneous nuclear ribonucleoprotein A3-like [Benincasa hispida]
MGIQICLAARVLTTSDEGGYGYPSSGAFVGENGVGSYGGDYNPKGYGYGKYGNDYYNGWRWYGQGSTISGYGSAPGYEYNGKDKGGEYDYYEQYGQGYGGGGGERGGSFKGYDSRTSDGGAYNYRSYGNNEKTRESSKDYFGYRYGGKSRESFKEYGGNELNSEKWGGMNKYPYYGNSNKDEKSSQEYSGGIYGGDSSIKQGDGNVIYDP